MTDIIKKIDRYLLTSTPLQEKKQSYKEFFQSKLKKYGVSNPGELKGDKKKEFFDEIDREWKGKKEAD